MDFDLLEALNGAAARHTGLEHVMRFFATDGVVLFVLALLALSVPAARFANSAGRRGSALAGASAGLALVIAQVIGHAWDRARPYEAHAAAVRLFLPRSADASFPSDHATGAFAIATAVVLYNRRAGALLLALAVLVSVSRVGLGTHYPSDVTAGALLGAASAGTLRLLARAPLERMADAVGRMYDHAISHPRRRHPTA